MFDRTNYDKLYKPYVESLKVSSSKKEKEYLFRKGDDFVSLMEELDNKGFLKETSQENLDRINEICDVSINNFDHVRQLYLTLQGLRENRREENGEYIILNDEFVGEIKFSAKQLVIAWGWAYSSLCEIMRQFLISLIDFEKVNCNQRNKITSGLGSAIWSLKNLGIEKLSFFNDIDTNVRNAFSHFEFRFDGNKIHCWNDPEKYQDNPWRGDLIEGEEGCIILTDLLKLVLNADRSTLPMMFVCIDLIKTAKQ